MMTSNSGDKFEVSKRIMQENTNLTQEDVIVHEDPWTPVNSQPLTLRRLSVFRDILALAVGDSCSKFPVLSLILWLFFDSRWKSRKALGWEAEPINISQVSMVCHFYLYFECFVFCSIVKISSYEIKLRLRLLWYNLYVFDDLLLLHLFYRLALMEAPFSRLPPSCQYHSSMRMI